MKLIYNLSYVLVFFSLLCSCKLGSNNNELKVGNWLGSVDVQGNEVPFIFEVRKDKQNYYGILHNSDEELNLGKLKVQNDSIFIKMHIFDIDIKAKIKGDYLVGIYTKNYAKDYELPFRAKFGNYQRFANPNSNDKYSGTWDVTFKDDQGKETKAIGIFKTAGNLMKGTFLTNTGDYRFLEGYTKNGKMYLYTFDGNHAFAFKFEQPDEDHIKGDFWSGKTWHESFVGFKNPDAKLYDPYNLTKLKEGESKISFSLPNLEKQNISPQDSKYKDKVLLLQIFGTWCPNCMDETQFLSKWYNQNRDLDVEILGLAFESKDDFDYARDRVQKMIDTYNIQYDYVIAGTSDKEEAAKVLPMLNGIISFPTLIFIDKKGEVRRIHTGFSGPATGDYYTEYVSSFNDYINELLNE